MGSNARQMWVEPVGDWTLNTSLAIHKMARPRCSGLAASIRFAISSSWLLSSSPALSHVFILMTVYSLGLRHRLLG